MEKTTSDYDKEKLSERLAKLSGGVAKINVGGGDRERDEGEEGPRRGRPARHPGRHPGRHPARRRRRPAARRRTASSPKGLTHDEEVGYNIVVRACRSPIKQIAENAGQDGDVVVNKVLENKDATSATTPATTSTATWSRPASSTRPR